MKLWHHPEKGILAVSSNAEVLKLFGPLSRMSIQGHLVGYHILCGDFGNVSKMI